MTTGSTIKVWDLFIRFFHWSLVTAFIVSYLTEGENNLHFYSGWFIAVMLVLRIIWGFIGSKHARFNDFVKPLSQIKHYTKSLIAGSSSSMTKYTGHNPLGGLMIIALLASLSMSVVSGVMLYSSTENSLFSFVDKPLLQEIDEHEESETEGEEVWEEIHEIFVNLTLAFIIIHIIGVLVSSWLHNENLIKAMFTGKKTE